MPDQPRQRGNIRGPTPSPADLRLWRHNLGEERAERVAYLALAARRTGTEREILLALAEAERRHEDHWLTLLGDQVGPPQRGKLRTRMLAMLARRFGGLFMLAMAQRAEARTANTQRENATAAMAADERIHAEVIRGLATRGRHRLSGTFRAAVFGANDGLVSNLALILGIGASGASTSTVLLSGLAGLLAGALSMGAGEYVSIRSQRELLDASRPSPRASAALPDLDVNANELALVYRARGMGPDEAEAHAALVLAEYTTATVIAPGPDEAELETHGTAVSAALSSFCFFASGALIPVLPYILGATGMLAVWTSAGLVGIALLITGTVVGLLSGTSPLTRALRQLAIGFGAAAVTYGLGSLFGATVS